MSTAENVHTNNGGNDARTEGVLGDNSNTDVPVPETVVRSVSQGKTPNSKAKISDLMVLEGMIGALGTGLEEGMARVERIEHDFAALENHVFTEVEHVKGELQDLQSSVVVMGERISILEEKDMARDEWINGLEAKMMEMFGTVQAQLAEIKASVLGGGMVARELSRADIPRPKPFDGKRDAKRVENFLWDCEQYFEGMGIIDEVTKVRVTTP